MGTDDIEVNVVQGGERRGWLRANDRTMILQLTFQHLNTEERKRWLALLAGTSSGAAEVELGLRYDDGKAVIGKQRGQYPERVRLVKFDHVIKSDSDQVMLWNNVLTLVIKNGSVSLKEAPSVRGPYDFFRVTEERGKICLQFKLTTNVTSKSHEGRSFKYCAHAYCGQSVDSLGSGIHGASFDFELVAKHKTEKGVRKSAASQQPSARASSTEKAIRVHPPAIPEISLVDVRTDGHPGAVFTCTGQHVTDGGVMAELTLVEETAEGGRGRKRKRAVPTLSKRVRRDPDLSEDGKFVSRLPHDLPVGEYVVTLISGSSKLRNSKSLTLIVTPAVKPKPARKVGTVRRASRDESLAPPALNPLAHVGTQLVKQESTLFKCDSSLDLTKQYSTSWPQSKAVPDEYLFDSTPLPSSQPSTQLVQTNSFLVPSTSELDLSYSLAKEKGSSPTQFQGLTRSVSEEQLKIRSNDAAFDLAISQNDVANITRNLWLSGPNTNAGVDSVMDTDESSDELSGCGGSNAFPLSRSRSLLARQSSEVWSQFLASEDNTERAAASQSAA